MIWLACYLSQNIKNSNWNNDLGLKTIEAAYNTKKSRLRELLHYRNVRVAWVSVLAELRWPEGPSSRAPYSSWERKGNPWVDFLMLIMASGIARGRVRGTTTAARESRNMATEHQIYETCSLGLPCTSSILDIHVVRNWHLSKQGICWPLVRGHIAGSSWELIKVTCFLEVDRWPRAGFSNGSRIMSSKLV